MQSDLESFLGDVANDLVAASTRSVVRSSSALGPVPEPCYDSNIANPSSTGFRRAVVIVRHGPGRIARHVDELKIVGAEKMQQTLGARNR